MADTNCTHIILHLNLLEADVRFSIKMRELVKYEDLVKMGGMPDCFSVFSTKLI